MPFEILVKIYTQFPYTVASVLLFYRILYKGTQGVQLCIPGVLEYTGCALRMLFHYMAGLHEILTRRTGQNYHSDRLSLRKQPPSGEVAT